MRLARRIEMRMVLHRRQNDRNIETADWSGNPVLGRAVLRLPALLQQNFIVMALLALPGVVRPFDKSNHAEVWNEIFNHRP